MILTIMTCELFTLASTHESLLSNTKDNEGWIFQNTMSNRSRGIEGIMDVHVCWKDNLCTVSGLTSSSTSGKNEQIWISDKIRNRNMRSKNGNRNQI